MTRDDHDHADDHDYDDPDPLYCVYPQKGADVAALPERWREQATYILSKWRDDHGRYQGCCCAYGDHAEMDHEEVNRLTNAGFLVEKP